MAVHKLKQLVAALAVVSLTACGGGGGGGGTSSEGSTTGSGSSTSSLASSQASASAASRSSTASSSSTGNSTSSTGSSASSRSSAASSGSVASSSSAAASSTTSGGSTSGLAYKGVSLAVAEFGADTWGGGTLPGSYGSTYTYPTNQEVDYFVAKGMNTLRLPFRWERLQRTLGGALDTAELGYIDSFVSYATAKGAYVVLDPHNYARYYSNTIGSASVSQAQFADLWSRLASHYKGNSRVIFALMNEPHDMDSTVWLNAANAAIAAIRAAGAGNLILVPGNSWTGAHSWVSSGNGSTMLGITDSGNNYAFEVHQYLDGDSSGNSASCVSSSIGAERLAAFTAWLKSNGKRGFLGEFAGGNDSTCQSAVTGMLDHLKANSTVWIGWTWWAAGPWWGDYIFTLEPTNSFSTDRAQMSWLTPWL